MTDGIPRKYDALIRVRKELTSCSECGKPYASVNANSHKTSTEEESVRFYFQFLHEDHSECIGQVMAVDFGAWMDKRLASQE